MSAGHDSIAITSSEAFGNQIGMMMIPGDWHSVNPPLAPPPHPPHTNLYRCRSFAIPTTSNSFITDNQCTFRMSFKMSQ